MLIVALGPFSSIAPCSYDASGNNWPPCFGLTSSTFSCALKIFHFLIAHLPASKVKWFNHSYQAWIGMLHSNFASSKFIGILLKSMSMHNELKICLKKGWLW